MLHSIRRIDIQKVAFGTVVNDSFEVGTPENCTLQGPGQAPEVITLENHSVLRANGNVKLTPKVHSVKAIPACTVQIEDPSRCFHIRPGNLRPHFIVVSLRMVALVLVHQTTQDVRCSLDLLVQCDEFDVDI